MPSLVVTVQPRVASRGECICSSRENEPAESAVTTQTTFLAVLTVVFVLSGLASFIVGEHLFAGLCFLLVTMTIYLRETRT